MTKMGVSVNRETPEHSNPYYRTGTPKSYLGRCETSKSLNLQPKHSAAQDILPGGAGTALQLGLGFRGGGLGFRALSPKTLH